MILQQKSYYKPHKQSFITTRTKGDRNLHIRNGNDIKKPPKDSEARPDKTGKNQIAEALSTASLVGVRFSIWMTSAALRLLLSTI